MFTDFSDEQITALASKQYESGDAGFPVVPEHTALLMIDMQEEFVTSFGGPFRVPEAALRVPVMARALEAFRKRGLPVIHTAFAATHHAFDRPVRGALMPNRARDCQFDRSILFRQACFVSALHPLEDEIVLLKPSYGAFYDTPLETILKRLGVDTVVLAGVLTDCCVGTTARQAYERGFGAIVLSDATATVLPAMHEAELKILRRSFARVIELNTLLAELEARPCVEARGHASVPHAAGTGSSVEVP